MSHEITKTDGLVLNKEQAWHGLGTVVETAPTPGQALTLASLDWKVVEKNLVAQLDDEFDRPIQAITTHKALRRSDTGDILSVVGKGYEPLQNEELAMFAYDLAGEADVRVESAGSLKGGRRVWFLLKAETLCVGSDCDEVEPYVLMYNSHDGSSAVEFMPTTIRVVCNNTLTMARGQRTKGFKFRHTTNLRDNIDGGIKAMRSCMDEIELWNTAMNGLASQTVDSAWLRDFWNRVYLLHVQKQPDNPTHEQFDRWVERKDDLVSVWEQTFEEERYKGCPPTKWLAANAVTRWMDHDKPVRMTKRGTHANVVEAKQWDKLFGITAGRKESVFALAR